MADPVMAYDAMSDDEKFEYERKLDKEACIENGTHFEYSLSHMCPDRDEDYGGHDITENS